MKIDSDILALSKNKRGNSSIVVFGDDGYAIDWEFKVHKAFASALGVSYGVKGEQLQSPVIVFSVGDSVNNYLIDETFTWLDFCKQDDAVSITVNFASGSGYKTNSNEYGFGHVRFDVHKPNKEKTKVELVKEDTCTALEFIHILRNGYEN